MDSLDEIVKNQVISSYENSIAFRMQLTNTFNTYCLQNIKYHMMWLFFHSFSFAYPDNPSDDCKIETANLIANVIPKNLLTTSGCGACQNDYKTYIEKHNVFRVVSSKQELSTFFVDLHNHINVKKFEQQHKNANNSKAALNSFHVLINSKKEAAMPLICEYSDVKNKYEQMDFISLLETKYSINMFKLIESKSLASFYELFNAIHFDSNGFNVDIQIV